MLKIRRTWASSGLVGSLLLVLFATQASGIHQESPNELRQIFPANFPERLSSDLSNLPETWAPWSDSLSETLVKVYGEDPLNSEILEKASADLSTKLATVKKALSDTRYRAIKPQLRGLEHAIRKRIALFQAIQTTLSADPKAASEASLARGSQRLRETTQSLEVDLNKVQNGSSWLKYLKISELETALKGDLATQKGAVEQSWSRLTNTETLPEPSREFLKTRGFPKLGVALSDYLATLNQANTPPDRAALIEMLRTLVLNWETYENEGTATSAAALRNSLRQLKTIAPDQGHSLIEGLRNEFTNYNMRLVVSEAFLNKMVAERRVEQSGVTDFILGADVSGCQITDSTSSFDLLPSGNQLRFNIAVSGNINSNTVGVTNQASIYTQGNHSFYATKEVRFDGEKFQTYGALISVDANNTTTGAETDLSKLPLIGKVTEKIAMNQAEKKKPKSEAIAASRVSTRVIPRLNEEVDNKFNDLNEDFSAKVSGPFRELGIYPDAYQYRTFQDSFDLSTRLMGTEEVGGCIPPEANLPPKGLSIQLHETLINNSLDRLEVGGKTMTEEELRDHIAKFVSKALSREVNFKAAPMSGEVEKGAPKAMIFDQHDPIRVRLTSNSIELIIRAAFKREGSDDTPAQRVTIPFAFEMAGDKIIVTPKTVSVAAVEKPQSVPEQLALAGVIRRKFESSLPKQELERKVNAAEEGKPEVWVNINKLETSSGWLTIEAE